MRLLLPAERDCEGSGIPIRKSRRTKRRAHVRVQLVEGATHGKTKRRDMDDDGFDLAGKLRLQVSCQWN